MFSFTLDLAQLFHVGGILVTEVSAFFGSIIIVFSFLRNIHSFICVFLSQFLFPSYYFLTKRLPSFINFSFRSFLFIYPSIAFFKSVLSNDFGRSARDCGLKFDVDVALYDTEYESPRVVNSARMFGTGVTDPDGS